MFPCGNDVYPSDTLTAGTHYIMLPKGNTSLAKRHHSPKGQRPEGVHHAVDELPNFRAAAVIAVDIRSLPCGDSFAIIRQNSNALLKLHFCGKNALLNQHVIR